MKGSEYLNLLVDDLIDRAVDVAQAFAREQGLITSPADMEVVEAIVRRDLGRQRDDLAARFLDRRWDEFVDAVEAGHQ